MPVLLWVFCTYYHAFGLVSIWAYTRRHCLGPHRWTGHVALLHILLVGTPQETSRLSNFSTFLFGHQHCSTVFGHSHSTRNCTIYRHISSCCSFYLPRHSGHMSFMPTEHTSAISSPRDYDIGSNEKASSTHLSDQRSLCPHYDISSSTLLSTILSHDNYSDVTVSNTGNLIGHRDFPTQNSGFHETLFCDFVGINPQHYVQSTTRDHQTNI